MSTATANTVASFLCGAAICDHRGSFGINPDLPALTLIW